MLLTRTTDPPDPYSQKYNEGWRNHPNFSWGGNSNQPKNQYQNQPHNQYQNQRQQQPQNSFVLPPNQSLEALLHNFVEKTDRGVGDLKAQMSKLTTSLATQEKGKFPSQPLANARGQALVIEGGETSTQLEELKSIMILRSGKVIDKTIVPKTEKVANVVESTPKEKLSSEKNWMKTWRVRRN